MPHLEEQDVCDGHTLMIYLPHSQADGSQNLLADTCNTLASSDCKGKDDVTGKERKETNPVLVTPTHVIHA